MHPLPPALRRLARFGLAGLAIALAFLSFVEQRRLAAGQAKRLAFLSLASGAPVAADDPGVPPPSSLSREIAREPDLARGAIVAARAVLVAELDPQRWSGLSPAEMPAATRASARRLTGAADLAAEAYSVRPAAWDAAMVLGASTYLARSETRDDRLLTAYHDWERPLAVALELGPGRPEANRFLAAAYLELWSSLTPAKRETARRIVAAALRDPQGFPGLIGPWLEVAPNRGDAFALIPDAPEAWTRITEIYASRQDWPGYLAARRRGRLALGRRLKTDLAEAEERLDGGDPGGARALLLGVASRAEHGMRQVGLLSRALEQCPPGPVDRGMASQLAGQLDWVLERCLVTECPLAVPTLRRLSRLCRNLEPQQEALADLFADDAQRGEQVERRADAQWSETWAPYMIAKARALARRGRGEDAAETLALVHRSWSERPSYWLARDEVARAQADPAAQAAARRELQRLAAFDYPGTAWTWRRGRARLEILAPAAAAGLTLAVDDAPAAGAAVQLRFDGSPAGTAVALPGGHLSLPVAISPGLHLLEIQDLVGGTVAPGDVRLRR